MNFIDKLFNPMRHCEDATAHLLWSLHIQFTESHSQKELTEHPKYPSMIAIADVIGMHYDVACAGIKIPVERINEHADVRVPFLAQIGARNRRNETLAAVTEFSNNEVELYNPITKKQENYTSNAFSKTYRGIILIVEAGEKVKEYQYKQHLKIEKQRNSFNSIALFAIPAVTLLLCLVYSIDNFSAAAIAPVVYTLLTVAGSLVTTSLLWHDVDAYNPVVKQICRAAAQVNCSSVLNSEGSKIAGLSWNCLGFVYSTGLLLSLLVTELFEFTFSIVAWLNVLALPYIIFSVYYQWKVVKRWCRLCVTVQGLLVLLLTTALEGGFYRKLLLQAIPMQAWVAMLASFAFVFALIIVLAPALQKAKDGKRKTIGLQRMKHNLQIFEGVLAKQKKLKIPVDDIGITLANPNGIYKLIKVCNPYCGPCAGAHPIMEELIADNEELCLQIIFKATNDGQDIKREPVQHLLAVDSKNDKTLNQKALDDWYNVPVKDYATFAAKYQLSGELKLQGDKITAMQNWFNEDEIAFTPTFLYV